MKYAVILGDGMADYPVPELDGKTPLMCAKHPNMDRLAKSGEFGLVKTVPEGMKPGSDTANLAVFGYDPKIYYSGRSPLEAASIGIDLKQTDTVYRCNFVTLADAPSIGESAMVDYSAGEITSSEAQELVNAMNEALANDDVHLYAGVSYRNCLVLKNGEEGCELTPPHDISGKPTAGHLPRGTNAELLLKWMETSFRILKDHPVNVKRVAEGKNPANCVWFWGEGRKPALKAFYEKTGLRGAVVSAVDLIQGIGICAGMRVLKVDGATGTYRTNFSGKANAAIDAFKNGTDYVYIHMEAPDECGHQHQVNEKVYSIEQIDEKVVGPVWQYLESTGEAYRMLILPDHPTPLSIMTHVGDPVPYILFRSESTANNGGVCYTEADAQRMNRFVEHGYSLIDRMMNSMGE